MHSHPDRRQAIAIIAGSGIVTAGIGAFAMSRQSTPRDPATLCRRGAAPTRQIAILIDRTERWPSAVQQLIAADIQRTAATAAAGDRITLFAFTGSADTLPAPAFDRCKLPSEGNIVFETPQRLARDHARHFAEPLAQTIASLTAPAAAPRSEIVQFLARLATILRAAVPPAPDLRIDLYSDMDENAPGFAFARQGATPEAFAAHLATHIGQRLQGITLRVRVLHTGRTPASSSARIARAWQAGLARQAVTYSWEPF